MTSLAVATGAAEGYDRVARAVHWLVAALAVIVISLGWAIADAPRNTPTRDLLLLLHRSVGLTILAATLFRAGWRWRHPPAPLPPSVAGFERALARSTQFFLYLIFIVMPLAGYVNEAAAGHAVSLFGVVSIRPLLPENDRLSQAAIAVHLVGQYLVYFFVSLHGPARCFTAFSGTTECSNACCRFVDLAEPRCIYYGHASVLKFIERNWDLKPLSARSRDNLGRRPRTLSSVAPRPIGGGPRLTPRYPGSATTRLSRV